MPLLETGKACHLFCFCVADKRGYKVDSSVWGFAPPRRDLCQGPWALEKPLAVQELPEPVNSSNAA